MNAYWENSDAGRLYCINSSRRERRSAALTAKLEQSAIGGITWVPTKQDGYNALMAARACAFDEVYVDGVPCSMHTALGILVEHLRPAIAA
jgi:hypothetical protein